MYENKTKDILEAKSGNQEMMAKIMENNSKLIWSIVIRFKDRGHELQDLYQIGCIGFIKAIKGFDSKYEVKLSTYAVPYILGEIKRYIRDDGIVKVSRGTKDLLCKIKLIQKEYMQQYGREISLKGLSEKLHISKEEITFAMESDTKVGSIDSEDDSGIRLVDRLPANINEEESIINKIVIKEMLNSLDEDSKRIITLRYFKGKTQCEVAKILKVSQVQVSRLEKKILKKMRES